MFESTWPWAIINRFLLFVYEEILELLSMVEADIFSMIL